MARAIVGDDGGSSVGSHHLPVARREAMRGFIAGRARFAEDALAEAVRAGLDQVVVLGAGLDTFAYRNPYPGVRVFEVDHYDTQMWKRERLAQAGIAVPDGAVFVPVDFERDELTDELAAAGFDPSRPAFVMWMGVTVYLTRDAITATLRALGGLAAGTELVFDYGVPAPEPADERERALRAERARRLAAIGERWISFLTPEEVGRLLGTAGFDVVEDVPTTEIARRYLGLDVRPGPVPRLVHARATGSGPVDLPAADVSPATHAVSTAPRESDADPVGRQRVIPILRVFDHALAREFYCGFLGFDWGFEHRFDADLPVYAEVTRDGAVLHLSEHHGDATPGSGVMIVVDDLVSYHRSLLDQRHRNARPGIQENPWGATMTVLDPFGNRLVFWQRT